MKINLSTRKSKLIILISLFVIFAISGGYLLWRVNQPETVAPEEGEATECQFTTLYCSTDNQCCVDGEWETSNQTGCFVSDPSMTCGAGEGSGGWEDISGDGDGDGDDDCFRQKCNTCTPTPTSCPSGYSEDDSGARVSSCPSGWKLVDGACEVYCRRLDNCGVYCGVVTRICYKIKEDYTVTYKAGANGSITGTKVQKVQKGGKTTQVTAKPNTGYTFNQWSDGNKSASRTDTVNGNATYTASFTAKSYTVTYEAEDNGSITGTRIQTVQHGGSTTQVTAVPSSGYYFGGWSDGKADNPRKDINVTKGFTVSASFSLSCGNGTCEADENAQNCPTDCDPDCGDGYCTHEETVLTCSDDCPADCGDGYCTHDETNETCPDDCPADCGDDYCDPETETAANCLVDCPADCGDGYCTHDETNETCPDDCPADCGDDYCDPATEDSSNCPVDCGYPVGANVPETGIFDDSQTSILVGLVLLLLGFTWRILGRGLYISISFLGKFPKKLSIHFKDVKEDIRARKRINLLKKRQEKRKKFEQKVVKD